MNGNERLLVIIILVFLIFFNKFVYASNSFSIENLECETGIPGTSPVLIKGQVRNFGGFGTFYISTRDCFTMLENFKMISLEGRKEESFSIALDSTSVGKEAYCKVVVENSATGEVVKDSVICKTEEVQICTSNKFEKIGEKCVVRCNKEGTEREQSFCCEEDELIKEDMDKSTTEEGRFICQKKDGGDSVYFGYVMGVLIIIILIGAGFFLGKWHKGKK